ncbi:antibiotic biosynthesis monooxygenase family protein [Neptuniibacter caesariensis]|uniref:ABM domain-containing protein n=1 Tax=Neptuniibacter caesariensis TaxID=207954 RepID=A0A7U8C4D8_NEPCE|nr:antibiotic biosynthesis monooxygenase family protein [Neptuniibacter caesariensis]EAR61320.1 hypothetical protein MED92_11354 [Oceanospirillum sp. MED92] [Neptuniibacter caesariensis]
MAEFRELNDQVSLADQMYSNEDGSIVLVNVFTVDSQDEEALVKAWQHDADFMRAQPGYISTQLHKGIAGSSTYINYAIWESVEAFKNAFTNPEFQKRINGYPDSAIAAPHLFKKINVPGHCVA